MLHRILGEVKGVQSLGLFVSHFLSEKIINYRTDFVSLLRLKRRK